MKIDWEYSDKAIAIQGDTKEHKEALAALGGKFNAMLRGGPGWIFSKRNKATIEEFVRKIGVKKIEETRSSEQSMLQSPPPTFIDSTKKGTRSIETRPNETRSAVSKIAIASSNEVLQNTVKHLSTKNAIERIDFLSELLASLRVVDLEDLQEKVSSPAINEIKMPKDEKLVTTLTKPIDSKNGVNDVKGKKMTIVKTIVPKNTVSSNSDVDSSDDEEEPVPRKRLLG